MILVGHGAVTSPSCGQFLGYRGCPRTELHDLVTLDGVDYRGKVFARKIHCGCHRPECPVCYKYNWAVRDAKNIAARLGECSQLFGKVEHIVVSLPMHDYGLSVEASRLKAAKILRSRGVIGGVMIYQIFDGTALFFAWISCFGLN